MKEFDFSLYIVTYNFIIGILLMLASDKIGVLAGYFMRSYREKVGRLARVGSFTFGTCVAVLSASIYVAGHLLKL